MRLGSRRKPEDKNEADRQKVIAFKRFFGTDEGRVVMLDLMNRYFILNPIPVATNDFQQGVYEGQRQVVLHLLGLAHTDMAQFEKILKGDFS